MWYGLFELPLWGYVLVTLALTHITIVSVTLYLHRCQAHRGLDLHPAVAHFFRFWLWLTTGMDTREWVAVHRKHHARVETEDDPHSPRIKGINAVLWRGAELYRQEASNPETLAKFGHGTPDDWLERKLYRRFKSLGVTLMALIDLVCFGVIGITIWAIQMLWIPFWAAGVINGLGHYWGYRNYEPDDASTNICPIGILIGGFPRESSTAVEIGGVRTNFRMPDLVSLAIGGGTIIGEKNGAPTLGPGSVGYRLTTEALVFGGSVPTLTDAIAASGRARIGDPQQTEKWRDLLLRAISASDAEIEEAVDRVKTSGRELPLIAVGGGSGLIPDSLAGVAEVHRPENYDVANAIGAAIASVSGEVDRVFAYGKDGRDDAIAEAVRLARDEAIRAGADPEHVEVVEVEEVPLAYLTDPVARIRVKAAGPLRTP